MIDTDIAQLPPGARIQPQQAQIGARLIDRRARRIDQIGRMGGKGRDHVARLEQEDARVPQAIPLPQQQLGPLQIRLFHETRQRHGGSAAVGTRGQLKIAVPGLGPVRGDAEGHQSTLFRRFCPFGHRRMEGGGVRQHMVRRRHQHQGIGVKLVQIKRRRQHRRRGVAPHGFDHHRHRVDLQRRQLFGHDKAEIGIGQHHGPLKRQPRPLPRQPRGGVLKQGLAAHQRHELLGIALARQRPKPCSRSTAQQNRVNMFHFGPMSPSIRPLNLWTTVPYGAKSTNPKRLPCPIQRFWQECALIPAYRRYPAPGLPRKQRSPAR